MSDLNGVSAAEASWQYTRKVLDSLSQDDRSKQTACSEYTVDGVLEHLTGSMQGLGMAGGAAAGEPPDTAEIDYVAGPTEAALAAWRARGVDGNVSLGDNEMPAGFVADILAMEIFVHGWDIADATGQSFDPPEDLSNYLDSALHQIIGGGGRRDAFADEVSSDGGASALDRVIAFSGRTPVGG